MAAGIVGALCNVLWAHGVLQTLSPELLDKICSILEVKPLSDFKPHVSQSCEGFRQSLFLCTWPERILFHMISSPAKSRQYEINFVPLQNRASFFSLAEFFLNTRIGVSQCPTLHTKWCELSLLCFSGSFAKSCIVSQGKLCWVYLSSLKVCRSHTMVFLHINVSGQAQADSACKVARCCRNPISLSSCTFQAQTYARAGESLRLRLALCLRPFSRRLFSLYFHLLCTA